MSCLPSLTIVTQPTGEVHALEPPPPPTEEPWPDPYDASAATRNQAGLLLGLGICSAAIFPLYQC